MTSTSPQKLDTAVQQQPDKIVQKRGIYALWDNKAHSLVGAVAVFLHVAIATRWMIDLTMVENSQIPKHPDDFELVHLGDILELENSGLTIEPTPPEYQLVMTGRQALAAAQAAIANTQAHREAR